MSVNLILSLTQLETVLDHYEFQISRAARFGVVLEDFMYTRQSMRYTDHPTHSRATTKRWTYLLIAVIIVVHLDRVLSVPCIMLIEPAGLTMSLRIPRKGLAHPSAGSILIRLCLQG